MRIWLSARFRRRTGVGTWLVAAAMVMKSIVAQAAQVVLITHGFQIEVGFEELTWMKNMADHIASRMDPASKGASVSQYNLQKIPIRRPTLALGKGPPPGQGKIFPNDMNVIVLVDWRAVSGIVPGGNAYDVGRECAEALLEPPSDGSFDHSLVEMPLHIIGHSRGNYVNSAIVQKLGRRGVWVDQVTILDAEDYGFEGKVRAWQNIRFLDNYFQRVDPLHVLDGQSIKGAAEWELTPYHGFKDRYLIDGISTIHGRVHTWYDATIDIISKELDGEALPRENWFGTSALQPETGYFYSRVVGGGRPPAGLKSKGAHREPAQDLEVAGADVWDNAECFWESQRNERGEVVFRISGMFEDRNRDGEIIVGWDDDANPYNGVASRLAAVRTSALEGETFGFVVELPEPMPKEGCVPFVKIYNSTHTRYGYGCAPLGRPAPPLNLRVVDRLGF